MFTSCVRCLTNRWQNLRSPQRLIDDHFALCVDAVNLKSVLGQIKADRANLHNGWLPYARECLTAFKPWHLDAVSGSHPLHSFMFSVRKHVASPEE